MRQHFMTSMWGLATAALLIATPVRAGALVNVGVNAPAVTLAGETSRSSVRGVAGRSADHGGDVRTPAATVPEAASGETETGGGWNELVCTGCVATATLGLFMGGLQSLPVLLANPELVGTFTGVCIVACRTVIEEMLK